MFPKRDFADKSVDRQSMLNKIINEESKKCDKEVERQ